LHGSVQQALNPWAQDCHQCFVSYTKHSRPAFCRSSGGRWYNLCCPTHEVWHTNMHYNTPHISKRVTSCRGMVMLWNMCEDPK
jgi:hypothetical protein